MSFETGVGVLGASIILVLFLLNQANVLKNDNVWYDALNAVGSFLLIVYAYFLESVPFAILNTVWFVASVYGTIKDIQRACE